MFTIPVTNYCEKYGLTQQEVDKMNDKFRNANGTFVTPSTDYEKEFAIDLILE